MGVLTVPTARRGLVALPAVGSEAWLDRTGEILEAGGFIVRELRGRESFWVATDRSFALACASLVAARPDIVEGWRTSLEPRVLLTLPSWPGEPRPWTVADMSESAWWHTLGSMQDDGLVVRPGRQAHQHAVNPRIRELHAFLSMYRHLLSLPPDDIADAGVRGQALCVHQRGAEAAWRLPHTPLHADYRPAGPAAEPGLATLFDPFTLVYAGRRKLKRVDHAMLYALAGRQPAAHGTATFEPRVLALLAFACGRRLTADRAFAERAAFYGIPQLPEALADTWTRAPDSIAAHGRGGLQEGWLEDI